MNKPFAVSASTRESVSCSSVWVKFLRNHPTGSGVLTRHEGAPFAPLYFTYNAVRQPDRPLPVLSEL